VGSKIGTQAFRIVTEFPARTLRDALVLPPRGQEGVVVRFVADGTRVKIKEEAYVALHRILTNTSARVLWNFLAVNSCKDKYTEKQLVKELHLGPQKIAQVLTAGDGWLDRVLENVPDEFYAWVRETIDELTREVFRLSTRLKVQFDTMLDEIDKAGRAGDRKAFAICVQGSPHQGALWNLYQDRDITAYLWRSVYPEAETPFKTISEDVA
jgi:RNA ligase